MSKLGQEHANISLKYLSTGGSPTKMGSFGVNALVQMISTNQSMLKFAGNNDAYMSTDDFIKIIRNTALKSLSFKGCKEVARDAMLEAITDALPRATQTLGLQIRKMHYQYVR